ncbi:MAG TPA: ABC transporter permease [Vicinamibacterales bacterium]|nr:ABC transporter permease [Vicinamibacterales bacterium]
MTLFKRRVTDAEIDEELRTHLKMAIEDRIARGQSPEDARRSALLEFGNLRVKHEDVRNVWRWTTVEQLIADIRSGFQILTRSPGISVTAIALIALVIGGNTTIFSIVHGLLTKPAPTVTARGLVSLGWAVDRQPVHPVDSYANYLDVAAQSHTVRPLLGFQFERFTLTYRDGSYAVHGAAVSPNYFETLGVALVRGRAFTDDEGGSSALTAVVSHRIWTERFQQREDVIGQSIALNGHPATVVGVAPPGFEGVWLAERSDVWVPIVAYARARGAGYGPQDRSWGAIAMLGRLAPGASMSDARSELATIAARLESTYPASNKAKNIVPYRYSVTAAGDSILAQRGMQFLAIFQIVTALTLLIVCANVANLMLARAVVRQREMAVRQSFGASRLRVVRLVLAEGIAISTGAWAVACLFAWGLGKVVAALLPPANGAPMTLDFTPDGKVIAYAMALAAVGTIAFTIGPAIRTWRQDLLPFLKAGEQGVIQGRSRLASGLVVVQLAFAVLLLASAGLAYRSLSLVNALDLGFNPRGILLVTVKSEGVPEGVRATLIDRMRDRLMSVTGVTGVTDARVPPKEFWSTEPVRIPGAQPPITAERNTIGPEYLHVLGLTPRFGRELRTEDRTRTTTAAVINENLAQALWPGEMAVGRTVFVGDQRQPVEVVGVAPNAFFSGFRREERPYFIFLPRSSDGRAGGETTFYIRYSGPLDAVGRAIGGALAEVDSRAPIVYMRTMETQLAEITSIARVMTTMLSLFAAASLLIGILGQYAVLAFIMKRRTRDFGVRMALGASARQILGSVIREGLRLTALGLVIGSALSLVSGRALGSLLFGVTSTDPLTYGGVVAVLACASLIACWIPGWRASRVDPMEALRDE